MPLTRTWNCKSNKPSFQSIFCSGFLWLLTARWFSEKLPVATVPSSPLRYPRGDRPEGWALGRSCSYPPQGTEQQQGRKGGFGMAPFPGSSDRLLPTVSLLVPSPLIGHLVRAQSQLGVFLVGDLSNESCKAQGGRVLGLSGHLDRSLPSQKAPPCHCPQD